MKLTIAVFLGLVVCFAVVNGAHHEYDGQYTTKPPTTPQERAGPVEEETGGEETGGEAGGENGGEGGEETGGETGGEETGGEETGGEMAEKPAKEHPTGMGGDTDAEKHKGYCHWEIGVWMKPGISRRCGCMRCMCKKGGVWDCNYHFAYCPYYYCGNLIFNPHNQICCCGKVHDKKTHHQCCGYYYYDVRHSKCCNYYSVRAAKSHCPRDRV